MTKDCLRYAPMIGSRPGELDELDALALSTHLEGCASCRALSAEAALTEGLVAEALLARASARDFAPFVDEVMARVGDRPRRASLLGQLRQHWKAVALSAAAIVAVAAGSAFMYVRSATVEEPERVAAVSMELQGGSTVLQTSDGPVVLLEPDDDAGS